MASQLSLTIATVFVTTEKLYRTVILTAKVKMQQQLLTTTKTTFATSFKIIFAILCHRQVKQTKSMMGTFYRQIGIPRWSVTIKHRRSLQLRITVLKMYFSRR